jgi:hypothetical protein
MPFHPEVKRGEVKPAAKKDKQKNLFRDGAEEVICSE